jgi:hypothetical protein
MTVQWGAPGDVPIAHANFSGIGQADIAVYRPSNQTWYVLPSVDNYSPNYVKAVQWGAPGDVPVFNSDFLGYGNDEAAVFRPSNGTWYVKDIWTGATKSAQWGTSGDIPLASSDFFGDGLADFAVFRPSNGTWYIKDPSTGAMIQRQWGTSGDVPLANADFDGDGRADIAVFRPMNDTWCILPSASGFSYSAQIIRQWGTTGDEAIPGPGGPDPILSTSGAVYHNFAGTPLFAGGGPQPQDVVQGGAADCYFMAELAALAKNDPARIRQSIFDMGNGTYGVDLSAAGKDQYVLVNAELPVNSSGAPIDAGLGPRGDLWVALMEKAWTFARPVQNQTIANGGGVIAPGADVGTYAMLDGNGTQAAGKGAPGGYQSELFNLMGLGPQNFNNTPGNQTAEDYFFDGVVADLNAGEAILVGTVSSITGPSGLIGYHSYLVDHINYTYDSSGFQYPASVTLYNPYGTYVTVSLSDFEKNVGFATAVRV